MKKVNKLICESQPNDWLQTVRAECSTYPLHGLEIDNEGLIIDVGANVGGFVKAWKHISNNWWLVEPSKYNQEEIQKNLKDFNYKLFKNAVGSKSGEILKLQRYMQADINKDTPSGNMGTTGFVYDNAGNHGWQGDYEEVESISLEDLIGDKKVEVLKVDCEGAEYDFLINAALSNVNIIVAELHNFLGSEKQQKLCEWIEQTHDLFHSRGGGQNHFIKGWKKK